MKELDNLIQSVESGLWSTTSTGGITMRPDLHSYVVRVVGDSGSFAVRTESIIPMFVLVLACTYYICSTNSWKGHKSGEHEEAKTKSPKDVVVCKEASSDEAVASQLTEDTAPESPTETTTTGAITKRVSHRDHSDSVGAVRRTDKPLDSKTKTPTMSNQRTGSKIQPRAWTVRREYQTPSSEAGQKEKGGKRSKQAEGVRRSRSLFAKDKVPDSKAHEKKHGRSSLSRNTRDFQTDESEHNGQQIRSLFPRSKSEQRTRPTYVANNASPSRFCTQTLLKTKSRSVSPPRYRTGSFRTRSPPNANESKNISAPTTKAHGGHGQKRVGVSPQCRFTSKIPRVASLQKSHQGGHELTLSAREGLDFQPGFSSPKTGRSQRSLSTSVKKGRTKVHKAQRRSLGKGTQVRKSFVTAPPANLTFNPTAYGGYIENSNYDDDALTYDTTMTGTSCTIKTNGGFQRIMEEIKQIQSKRDVVQKELDVARSELSRLKAVGSLDHDYLVSQVEQAQQELEKAKAMINKGEAEKRRLESSLTDANREVHDMRMQFSSFQTEATATISEIEAMGKKNAELQSQVNALISEKMETYQAFHVLREKQEECVAWEAQMNAISSELEKTRIRSAKDIEELEEDHKTEIDAMKFTIRVMRGRMLGMAEGDDGDLSLALGGQSAYAYSSSSYDIDDPAVARAIIECRDEKIAILQDQLHAAEQERRKMHNRIQELRGNIRVFVRVRPFVSTVDDLCSDSSLASPISFMPGKEKLVITNRAGNEDLEFSYDKVFHPTHGQEAIFQEVSDLVQSAIDGYNVCIFSYGQTGSGKTHTMLGFGDGEMKGIIPRAVEQILQQARVRRAQKWEFHVKASFLEIYNETLRDLLIPDDMQSGKLTIRRDEYGRTFVDGLSCVDVDSTDESKGMEQLSTLMSVAAQSRSVALTKMNTESSRSHTVFILDILGFNEDAGTIITGSLNLCDLAGSERLKRSKIDVASPERLKETQAINKSLSSLGDVFNALASGTPHVPYRNSKLTHLLQDCFSGDGKTLMMVNLSPTAESCHESLCSLQFAQRVNSIELGKAVRHVLTER